MITDRAIVLLPADSKTSVKNVLSVDRLEAVELRKDGVRLLHSGGSVLVQGAQSRAVAQALERHFAVGVSKID